MQFQKYIPHVGKYKPKPTKHSYQLLFWWTYQYRFSFVFLEAWQHMNFRSPISSMVVYSRKALKFRIFQDSTTGPNKLLTSPTQGPTKSSGSVVLSGWGLGFKRIHCLLMYAHNFNFLCFALKFLPPDGQKVRPMEKLRYRSFFLELNKFWVHSFVLTTLIFYVLLIMKLFMEFKQLKVSFGLFVALICHFWAWN